MHLVSIARDVGRDGEFVKIAHAPLFYHNLIRQADLSLCLDSHPDALLECPWMTVLRFLDLLQLLSGKWAERISRSCDLLQKLPKRALLPK